jgi:hypothetical protein
LIIGVDGKGERRERRNGQKKKAVDQSVTHFEDRASLNMRTKRFGFS